jgi:3-hydroxybutyryl-CoA dehydrogenase
MTEIRTVGVVGGGLMGSGIAQVAAVAGYRTVLREVDEGLAARARSAVERSLAKAIDKGKLAPDARDAALARLACTTTMESLAECDLVIEAVVEHLETKRAVWRALDALAPAATIFASNTSSLSIVEQATATGRSDRFVGLHFFNPVPAMPLVEVVRTVTTSATTMAAAIDFVRAVGKTPIVARDSPGFVVNLLLVPYMLDAVRALEQGVASTADIDTGMQLGAGHPMGPLALCDFVGLDTLVRVAEIMWGAYREPRYAPPPLLVRMVAAGMLGRKNGRGFYDHGGPAPVPNDSLR